MHTRNFLRSCYHGLVGRVPAYLLGAVFTAGLAFSVTSYAVHDIGVFELDNSTTGANAIDQPTDASPPSGAADWAQNNYPNTLNNCPDGVNSCGYVSGPDVDPDAPGGGAFRSLFIPDPNGAAGDGIFAGGGSKDDLDVNQWLWKTGATSSDKTDLLPVGAAAYLNGDLLIYTFGTLFAPNGDAAIGTWLFKKNIGLCGNGSPPGSPFGVGEEVVDPNTNIATFVCDAIQPTNLHSIGDVLVVSENTNGGRDVGMAIYQWVDENDALGVDTAAATAAKAACVADGHTVVNNTLCLIGEEEDAACSLDLQDDDFCGTMNLGEIKGKDAAPGFPTESPDDWGYLAKSNEQPAAGPANPAGTDGIGSDDFPPTTLFEAGFNFSKLFPSEVGCFNTFLMNTRASQSVDSVLEDVAIGKFPLCGIKVEKTGDTLGKIGDPVDYTITITNTGAITLSRDSIIDDVLGDLADPANPYVTSSTCGATLDPEASCVIEATRTVIAGDPDPLPNTVEVVYSAGEDEQTAEASHSVNLFQPDVSVVKTGDTLSKVGDPVDYTIVVTNDSSDDSPDLVNGTIVDTLLGNLLDAANPYVTASNCTSNLAQGASCTISATRTVLAGDPDPLPNTVTVHYNPDGFPNDISANDSHIVELFQPSVTIDKTGDTLSKLGDPVDYTITVTNTSSADSPDLVCDITDTLLGTLAEDVTLASGSDPYVINTSRTVQEGDPDPLPNTATVTCSPVGFPNELTDSDDHSVNLFQPSVAVDKSGDALSKVGDPANYTIVVTNTGSNDSPNLVGGTIVDDVLGNLLDGANPYVTASTCSATLATGASCTISATRIVQAGDPDPLVNVVTVHYNPDGFPNDISDSDDHSVNLFQPSVTVDKTANCDAAGVTAGADITYSYLITNTSSGDSPNLDLATVLDDKLGDLTALAAGHGCSSLAPGATCSFDFVYTTTALDVGTVINHVDVLYHPVDFPNNIPAEDDQECLVVPPEPAFVVIEKVLLNSENAVFNYSATGLPDANYVLTPLFGNLPLNDPPFVSPFAAPGAGNGFATTDPEIVPIALVDDTEDVSVTELLPLPPFVNFVSLDCQAVVGDSVIAEVDLTANLTVGSGDIVFCRYVNEFNPGDEGCTPGFWKNHLEYWVETGYAPDDLLNSVFDFGGNFAGLADDTLFQALNYPGGNNPTGAAQILLRAAVAAVLNASHPGVQFSLTEGDVIADVSAALASGNRSTMLALATTLDNANNGVFDDNIGTESCPLGGPLPQ